MKRNYSKGTSLALLAVLYAVAFVEGLFVFRFLLPVMPEVWALFVADVAATVFIWAAGLVYENVSVYDPYWSVAPPVIFTAWALFKGSWGLPVILLLVAVWAWGIRLTGNWATTFKGIGHEDWRYAKYREKQHPALFQLTNFFGLNMMPTVIVFACMLPGLGVYETAGPASVLTWIGAVISLSAAAIQLLADTQIHRFRASHPGQLCDVGLWKKGRHPNYFGEILFWWGVWVMYASFNGIDWLILAPVAMTSMFLFISIPLMERRQLQNKPGYADYRKRTRILI